LNELALFAGAGGGILGGHLLGWRTVCAVEWEPYPASVLCARQNDGLLPPFPIWDDVQTFDGKPWQGIVDVVSGGFPCQDISVAGKGAGIEGERSGMWSHMARIIGEVRPRFVFVENSPALITRGLGRVLGDLAALGYDCRWTVLGAADVGAPHQRNRFWLVAHANGLRKPQPQGSERNERGRSCNCGEAMGHADLQGLKNCAGGGKNDECTWQRAADYASSASGGRDGWRTEPGVGRMAYGVAARVDRLKAIGNGQVPLCAATAWRILSDL
jgi:DNA (cytosine-5)-methyltransferase 1